MAREDGLALVLEDNATGVPVARAYLATRYALSAGWFRFVTADTSFSARFAASAGSAVHHLPVEAQAVGHVRRDVASVD